jgi:hypothetical protein
MCSGLEDMSIASEINEIQQSVVTQHFESPLGNLILRQGDRATIGR